MSEFANRRFAGSSESLDSQTHQEIIAPSNVFPPPIHATLSVRSRCVFIANPLTVHSLHNIESEVPSLPFNGHVDCLRLSADERNIAVASNDLIKLIDLTRGREIRNLSGHSLAVKALTPRRSSVYSWVSGSLDSSWIVWDSRSHPANVLQGRTTGPVRCVELSPDDIILTVGTDSTLQLYDIRKRCSLKQFPSSTHGATFHPSQRMVATYGAERVVRFWCLDELVPVAMSDAFSSEIRCAQFASPSTDMDPVLIACTDHYMKTLTCEPCESLTVNQIGDLRKVLHMNASSDGVGVICTDSVGAVSYSVVPMEELLEGPKKPVDFYDDEDDDESLSDEIAVLTLRGESPSVSSLTPETISVPSAIHISSSDCGIDDSSSIGKNQVSNPVRSSSSDRNAAFRTTLRNLREPMKRRTDADKNLLGRPRSPSMSSIQSSNESHPMRLKEGSRLICRSVSPANGATSKESSMLVVRSAEKPLRPTAAALKPPREPNRVPQRDARVTALANADEVNPPRQRKNSTQGLPLEDFAIKMEKGHYVTVMQAEKTSIGVHQLAASLKHGGLSAMLKDGLFADESAVAVMLRMFNETKRWDINICSMYLPKLKEFLQDTTLPESCRQVALSSLQSIATGLIDSLRNCARAPVSSIGVDVAAEERKKKADSCIEELKDLRDRRDHFYRKLSQEEVYRLDAIMVFLKSL